MSFPSRFVMPLIGRITQCRADREVSEGREEGRRMRRGTKTSFPPTSEARGAYSAYVRSVLRR